MDPWDHIRRAASDTRSGSTEIAMRAAIGLAELTTRRDVARAARALLRAHPSMAALWRLLGEAHEADDIATAARAFASRLGVEREAASDGARWVVTKRNAIVLTHSSSSAVVDALQRVRGRIARVLCTTSLPGGEGRPLARRLTRDGFDTEIVPDAAIASACDEATIALVGADAITDEGVVNKVGTRLVALAAREAGIGCYAIACGSKMMPARAAHTTDPLFDSTPLELFDAVLTERGPVRPAAVRRAVARIRIPSAFDSLG